MLFIKRKIPNREQILKSLNNLSKEVKLGMKKDEKKFNELQNMKP